MYTAHDLNPSTWEKAVEGDKGVGYRPSKMFAEKAGQFRKRTTYCRIWFGA